MIAGSCLGSVEPYEPLVYLHFFSAGMHGLVLFFHLATGYAKGVLRIQWQLIVFFSLTVLKYLG